MTYKGSQNHSIKCLEKENRGTEEVNVKLQELYQHLAEMLDGIVKLNLNWEQKQIDFKHAEKINKKALPTYMILNWNVNTISN